MRQKNKNNSGMTIVEMMVAIAILVVAMAGFTLLFLRSWKVNSYTIEMGQASFSASQGVNTVVGYVRKVRQADNGSYPISLAKEQELVVFSDYDKDGITERLHFYLQNEQIKMGVANPTNTIPKIYPTDDEQTNILANNIVNTISEPIFYYYNNNYPGDAVNNPLGSPVNISTVRLIKIFLKVNIDPARNTNDIEMQSFVELRNLNDYDRIK
jgi:type II secretory pathway pseudopilin PulG